MPPYFGVVRENPAHTMIKKIFYVLVYIVSTIAFVVIFESGPDNFVGNLEKKFTEVRDFAVSFTKPPKPAK